MLLNQKDLDELAKMYIEMIDIIFELNNNYNYDKRRKSKIRGIG